MKKNYSEKLREKVIILSRVSTLGQDLVQQTESVKRLVKLDGYSESQIIIIEDKESAVLLSEEERNGLNEMKRIISESEGKISCVYVYEISRISRKSEINYSIRDYLRENHVQLKIVTPMITVFDKDWNISPEANLMYSLFSALAENEGYIRKARFARGKQRNKQLGKFNGGRKLFGYDIDENGYYVCNEEESNIVKRIYHEYCFEGKSSREIATELYNEGIINQNYQRCRDNFVLRILRTKHYTGNNQYPIIVSENDFKLAESIRMNHVIKPRRCYENNIYFGHKLLFVENTDRQLIVRKTDCSYVEENSKICLNMNITDTILMYCADYAYRQHSSGDYEKIITSYNRDLESCNRRLQNYSIKELKIKNSIDRLEERIILGNISEKKANELENKLKNELHNLSISRQKDLDNKITLEKNLEAIQEESDSNLNVYDIESDKDKKEFINKEIKFVKVKKIERGHYYLNVCYKNMLIDSQIFEVETRKKLIKLYGKEIKLDIIERFKRK